jgi:hypothetical protein
MGSPPQSAVLATAPSVAGPRPLWLQQVHPISSDFASAVFRDLASCRGI